MYRHACRLLVLTGVTISLSTAGAETQALAKEAPYMFCVDNYSAIRVNPEPKDAAVKLLQAPEGVELLTPGNVLVWSPTEKQIGEHVLRVFIEPKDGEPTEKEFRVLVKPLERVLCVFAHADDEFGIMAKMKRMADRGVEVWAAWTCGGNAVRDAESVAAMTKIGLQKDHLIFQGEGDFTSPDGLQQKIAKLAELLKSKPFDQIYTDAFEGGHSQHDMSGFIAAQAARQAEFRGQVYEFPLYNMFGGKPTMFTFIPAAMPSVEMTLSQAELDFIVSLVPCYPSQKAITRAFLVGMSQEQKSHPRYRPQPNWDYTRRPHKGVLMLELRMHEKDSTFAGRISGPTTSYFQAHGGNTGGAWEQDRTADEKALTKKVFADPYVAKE